MDELEKHIRSIRDELDINEPGPGLWSRIEEGLPGVMDDGSAGGNTSTLPDMKEEPVVHTGRKAAAAGLPGRQRPLNRLLWRAAVAVIVAGAAFAIVAGMLVASEKMNDPQVTEVRETYRYYDDKIRELYREAEPLLTANPDISTELTMGMSELDSLSAQIIRDLDDNIASSEVIEALIGNYRLRIELMEDMLRLMKENETEDEKTNGNEL
ncbi:MAG: hypothetical protein MUE37_10880 [Bacteroidales bacterium]|nr:hypothetical protein [Bacteroidales bacterium]